jgi:hypothetical protein
MNLYTVANLMPNAVYPLMHEMTSGRVIVIGEVLLTVDDCPLTRAIDPVLDLREQHPIVVKNR